MLEDSRGQQLFRDSYQGHGRIVCYAQHIQPGLDFLEHTVIVAFFLKYGKGNCSTRLLSSKLAACSTYLFITYLLLIYYLLIITYNNLHITGIIPAFGIISGFLQKLINIKCTNHPGNRTPILQPQAVRENNTVYFLTAFISKQNVRHLTV